MNQKCGIFFLAMLLLANNRPSTAEDAEWGNLAGRFLYNGEPPPSRTLAVPAYKLQTIGGKQVPDESLVLGEDGGIANVFIWLRPARFTKPPIHPSYDNPPDGMIELVAREYRFSPRAFFVRTGQKFNVRFADKNIGYNLKYDAFSNPPFSGLIPAGSSYPLSLGSAERVPISITCNIHPWMQSRLLILDHPYAAISDPEGRFEIRNLPVGKWDFVVVHERAGYIKQPTIGGRQLEWKRGTFQHEIAAGDNALGDILVAPKAFQRK